MSVTTSTSPTSHLREGYQEMKNLFAAQPAILQRFLETQASVLANALTHGDPQIRFSLPDRIVAELSPVEQPATVIVPSQMREQTVGSFRNRLLGRDVRDDLKHRLNQLEQSSNRAIAVAASLLRYAIAYHLVYNVLPSGRTVNYQAADDDEIPFIPVDDGLEPQSAITQASDAIAEEGKAEDGRGALQVPFVPAARRFYLPQWVSFDNEGKLLVGSVKEAEAHIASMQRYINVLHTASSLASYIIADEEYQKKRYGMLGQLVNQGRALARYKTQAIIQTIQGRAHAGSLNRGLSLSLPYFDDQDLRLDICNFEVIPAGRIMFVPAFVVRAAREEAAKRTQDTRFNASTRRHLIALLKSLEDAFCNSPKPT